jgi:hypothetical protein
VSVAAFYSNLGFPESSQLDKRIYKRLVLEHGQLTNADKKTLSEDVCGLTWKYTLKPSTVQVLPYEDDEQEYLEVAVIEAILTNRRRTTRIAEMIQRAIPYPLLLLIVEADEFCVCVARKRFSRSEKGSIIAEDLLCSPWIKEPLTSNDLRFCEALALQRLTQSDFLALYDDMVKAVLARTCAELTGQFALRPEGSTADRRQRLEQCHAMEREISSLRVAIHQEAPFAQKVELNTRIKTLEAQLDQTKTDL